MDFSWLAKYTPLLLSGAWQTVALLGISVSIGFVLAIGLALAQVSGPLWLRLLARGYCGFFRGTPLLIQLWLLYYGVGSLLPMVPGLRSSFLWPILREGFFFAAVSFTLNHAAYQAEILRGAVQSMPKGQWEGAFSLGLSRGVTFFKVILPQALIVALRPYGNEIILLLKGSAISSIVTIYDIMGEANRAFSRSFDFQAYIWAAVAYLIAVELIRRAWDLMERRLTRHLRHGK